MSDSRPIQRYQGGAPAGTIMTPQGPAVIQVIDMHAPSDLALGGRGPALRKPGGINILGAVLRRWWLVLLVAGMIGGAAVFAANNLVKPTYEARATISYHDPATVNFKGPILDIVHRAMYVLTARDIPLAAARDPDLQQVFPALQGRDLNDPVVAQGVCAALKDAVTCEEPNPGFAEIVQIVSVRPNPIEARNIANAYAKAFVHYCRNETQSQNKRSLVTLDRQLKDDEALYATLN